jgi:hypothetical protein
VPDYMEMSTALNYALEQRDIDGARRVMDDIRASSATYIATVGEKLPGALEKTATLLTAAAPDRAVLLREAKPVLQEVASTMAEIDTQLQHDIEEAVSVHSSVHLELALKRAELQATVAVTRAIVSLEKAFDTPNYETYRLTDDMEEALDETNEGDAEAEIFYLIQARQRVIEQAAHDLSNEIDGTGLGGKKDGPTVEDISSLFKKHLDIGSGRGGGRRGAVTANEAALYGLANAQAAAVVLPPVHHAAAPAAPGAPLPNWWAGWTDWWTQPRAAHQNVWASRADITPPPRPGTNNATRTFLQKLYERSSAGDTMNTYVDVAVQSLKLASNILFEQYLSVEFRDIVRGALFERAVRSAFSQDLDRSAMAQELDGIWNHYMQTITALQTIAQQNHIPQPERDPYYAFWFMRAADSAIAQVLLVDPSFNQFSELLSGFDVLCGLADAANTLLICGFAEEFFPSWVPVPGSLNARWRIPARMILGLDPLPVANGFLPFASIRGTINAAEDAAKVRNYLRTMGRGASSWTADGVPQTTSFAPGSTEPIFTDVSIPATLDAWRTDDAMKELFGFKSNNDVSLKDLTEAILTKTKEAVLAYPEYLQAFNPIQVSNTPSALRSFWQGLQTLNISRTVIISATMMTSMTAYSIIRHGNIWTALAAHPNFGAFAIDMGKSFFRGYHNSLLFDLGWRTLGIITREFEDLVVDQVVTTLQLNIQDLPGFLPVTDEEKHARSVEAPISALWTIVSRYVMRGLHVFGQTRRTPQIARIGIVYMAKFLSAGMRQMSGFLRRYQGRQALGRSRKWSLRNFISQEKTLMLLLGIEGAFFTYHLLQGAGTVAANGADYLQTNFLRVMASASLVLTYIAAQMLGKPGMLSTIGGAGAFMMSLDNELLRPGAIGLASLAGVMVVIYGSYQWLTLARVKEVPYDPYAEGTAKWNDGNAAIIEPLKQYQRRNSVGQAQAEAAALRENNKFRESLGPLHRYNGSKNFRIMAFGLLLIFILGFGQQLITIILDQTANLKFPYTKALAPSEYAAVTLHLARVHGNTVARPHLRLAFTDF